MPLQVGNIIYDIPVFNADIHNTVIDGTCPVPSAFLLWKAHNCSVKNPDYFGIVVDASGPCPGGGNSQEYDYAALGYAMKLIGQQTCVPPEAPAPAPPCWYYYPAAYSGEVQALDQRKAAEYLLAYSSDTRLSDKSKPGPRITQFHTTGTIISP
jgi:hypothetical protein